jgi:hypothetical protein
MTSLADIGLVVSSAMFFALYVSTIPLSLLSSDAVYNQQKVELDNVLPLMRLWTDREPLLVVLIAIGTLRLLRNLFGNRRIDFFDQLLVAAGAYWFILLLGGLVSKYFGALPLTAAAIAVCGAAVVELERYRPKFSPALFSAVCAVGVVANLLFGTPALLYRQDWITRNAEIMDELLILRPAGDENRDIFVKGLYYDARMLAVYGDVIRRANMTFLLTDNEPPERCHFSRRMCLDRASEPEGDQLVLDLGQLAHHRSATITRRGVILWRYEDKNLRRLMSLSPKAVRGLLRSHYSNW